MLCNIDIWRKGFESNQFVCIAIVNFHQNKSGRWLVIHVLPEGPDLCCILLMCFVFVGFVAGARGWIGFASMCRVRGRFYFYWNPSVFNDCHPFSMCSIIFHGVHWFWMQISMAFYRSSTCFIDFAMALIYTESRSHESHERQKPQKPEAKNKNTIIQKKHIK